MHEYYEEYTPKGYSVYEYLQKETSHYSDELAVSFYGRSFSYRELNKQIDSVAQALYAHGIRKDDVVASSLPGTPEGVFLIYAINKLGAIYCAFDCRSKSEEIRQTIAAFSPKLCFIPDFQVKEFRGIYGQPVIHLNPARSVGKFAKIGSVFADFFTGRDAVFLTHRNLISYDNFIRTASEIKYTPCAKSTHNIFGYFYTSGTTYGRKSIILSNENLNAAVSQQKESNAFIRSGDSILNIMPLFTCYSVTLAVHLPLTCGVRVNLIPLINPRKLPKLLLAEKPNYIISVPAHWEHFIKEDFTGCDLSFLKCLIVGGDTMNTQYRQKINEIFMNCGCPSPLIVGYGLSETTSTTSTTIFGSSPGSVGRPLKNTQIQICDPDTGSPVPDNTKGEICIYGPTVCVGYFGEPELSAKLLRKHDDGKVWLHSGDIGMIDRSGSLFFCERMKRMYVRYDGTKISPYSIEQFVSTCPLVERSMVVAIPDTEHSHGMCARLLIVLKDHIRKYGAKKRIEAFLSKNLDQHMIPKEVIIVDKLPYTKNGKLDYFAAAQDIV